MTSSKPELHSIRKMTLPIASLGFLIFLGSVLYAGVRIDSTGASLSSISQQPSSSATVSSVASSASNVTLLAANSSRKTATFYNDSNQTLYLKFGVTASTTSYTVQLSAGSYFEIPAPVYTGEIDGIWTAANGNCRITELS